MSPRYDVPKAAPEPLRRVQLFVNSIDVHNGVEWLPEWLEAHGLAGADARGRELREAVRALVLANNGLPLDPAALETFNRAAVVLDALLDGSWARLKACRNCRWSFYDYSPNRSATWCSMQLCGNRTKTREYRRRHRRAAAA